MKAWSLDLGHESLVTSVGSYGALSADEQADVMASIGPQGDSGRPNREAAVRRFLADLDRTPVNGG